MIIFSDMFPIFINKVKVDLFKGCCINDKKFKWIYKAHHEKRLKMTKDSIDSRCEGPEQSILRDKSARCHLYDPECPRASEDCFFKETKRMYPVCEWRLETIREERRYNLTK